MAFWQTVLRFQAGKIEPRLALRNTIGVALPLTLGVAAGSVPAGLTAAVGALNVSFSDSHEPYVHRARRMLAASGLVGSAVLAGALTGGNHPAAVAIAGAWAFAAGLLVALSTEAADLGLVSLVTLVVFAARPLQPDQAAVSALVAFGGGLFQTALAMAFWPVNRYEPERRALAALFVELSRAARLPPEVFQAPAASSQSSAAQNALAALGGDRSIEGERYRALLSQAERARLSLFALVRFGARVRREGEEAGDEAIQGYLDCSSDVLRAIGDALDTGATAVPPHGAILELESFAERLRAVDAGKSPPLTSMLYDARMQMDALTGQIRAALELASHATPPGLAAFARREVRKPWRFQLAGTFATLAANLNLRSAAFRHAVRISACVAAGDALARGIHLRRSYWLPMTVAIVLKPDFAATFSRGVLRLAGTLVGLVLSTALFHVLPGGATAQLCAIAVFVFALRCWGPANYGIFAVAVTALVVLLVAITGVAPQEVVADRGLNTMLGGALALLAYWLWPTWERSQWQEEMARMLDAYRDYFRAIRESYVQPERPLLAQLDRTRLAARLARSNLEASMDRLQAEPGAAPPALAALNAILATSHRFIHAVMALEAGLFTSGPAPARPAFARFADHVELTLYYLAAALRGSPLGGAAMPDLREDHYRLAHSGGAATERYALVNVETDRITNSLNTLAEELVRQLRNPLRDGGAARDRFTWR